MLALTNLIGLLALTIGGVSVSLMALWWQPPTLTKKKMSNLIGNKVSPAFPTFPTLVLPSHNSNLTDNAMKKEKKPALNAFGMTTTAKPITPVDPPKAQLIELRKLILAERGDDVVKKVLEIALDDNHPVQGAALKMAMDRLLPMSEFEKAAAGGRSAITINISGVGDAPTIVEGDVVE